MAYYLNLFSPETWTSFTERGADVTGFVTGMRGQAEQTIKQGDIMLCYMTKLSRWCGAIRIVSNAYTDPTPLFGVYETYPVRFQVESIVLLEPDFTIPLRDEALGNLSLMRPRRAGNQPWMALFGDRSGNFQKAMVLRCWNSSKSRVLALVCIFPSSQRNSARLKEQESA